jgi:hypothetical protein
MVEVTMNPQMFEQSVFDNDEIRIVVRAPLNIQLKPYKFVRKATDSTSLSEWLEQRIKPLIEGYDVVVVDGTGIMPHGRTKVEKVRNSYIKD